MSIRIGNSIVAGMPEKALHGIGEIFTTTDTGVIAGAVEANGGSYNLADYNSGADSVASKLASGTLSYVSKTEFQTQVANTGACDSFGWNGTSDATFLVPKLKPWHVGKSAPVVGNGFGLGLTNGVWTGNPIALASTTYTPFSKDGINETKLPTNNTKNLQNGTAGGNVIGVTTDPTKSGMIADLSETANLRVMVQLATGATDQALETCTSVLSDVSALNAHRVIEFQAPTAENGYTWYRKYADGWVEQGGKFTAMNTINLVISLPVPMASSVYSIIGTGNAYTNTSGHFAPKSATQTSFTCDIGTDNGNGGWWQVSGMSAQ